LEARLGHLGKPCLKERKEGKRKGREEGRQERGKHKKRL
jgi:hypothetical protein